MQQQPPSVVLDQLSLAFEDGTPVFDGLRASFGPGVTGIIGPNGLGKSALLRLVAGELSPTAGHVSRLERLAVLPQKLTLDTHLSLAEILGVDVVLAAIDELTTAEPSPERVSELLEIIGDRWDAEAAALSALDAVGLGVLAEAPEGLHRTVGTLSGGEVMLVALAALRATDPELTLLDEPTNNLDDDARGRLLDALDEWPGVVLVVSHDRALLRRVDAIAELRPARVRAGRAEGVALEVVGGGWDEYVRLREIRREAAERVARDAEASLHRERATRQEAETRLARTAKQGKEAAKSMPKILANTRRNAAEATAGRVRSGHAERVAEAQKGLDAAREALREVAAIDIDLPGTGLGSGTVVLHGAVPTLRGRLDRDGEAPVLMDDGVVSAPGATLTVRGPERIQLVGANGSGKSTLLEALLPTAKVPTGVLLQRTGLVGEDLSGEHGVLPRNGSVLRVVMDAVPGLTAARAREVLARLRLRGGRVDEPFGRLSGGERFRVDLARVLASDPPPQLLVLDEPTNDLDLDSVEALTEGLRAYRGAVILVSHDADFRAAVGITRTWELGTRSEAGRAQDDVEHGEDG